MNALERAVIEAARVMSDEGVNDHWTACMLVVAMEKLREHEAAQEWVQAEMIWVQRTWADVRAGDRVRPPGNTDPGAPARVSSVLHFDWHVDPRTGTSSWNPPVAMDWSCVRVQLDPTGPRDMNPAAPVEIELTAAERDAIELLGWENRAGLLHMSNHTH